MLTERFFLQFGAMTVIACRPNFVTGAYTFPIIDADKRSSKPYYERVIEPLRPIGLRQL